MSLFENLSPISLRSQHSLIYSEPSFSYSSCSNEATNFKTYLKDDSSEIKSGVKFTPTSFLLARPIKTINSCLKENSENNEQEKLKFIQEKVKPVYLNKYNTDTQKFLINQKARVEINERFELLKRKKYCSSTKKVYSSRIGFLDGDKIVYFPIYKDSDIGIKSSWDDNLKYMECDNDTETPKCVIDRAMKENIAFIKESIDAKLKKNNEEL